MPAAGVRVGSGRVAGLVLLAAVLPEELGNPPAYSGSRDSDLYVRSPLTST
jgi:hypothetical protein